MTFDERLEKEVEELYKKVFEHAFELGQEYHNEIYIPQDPCNAEDKAKAIIAIKQAIRETFGGKKSITLEDYSQDDLNNLSDSDIGVIINFRQGYNAKANEIEKGFGL